MAGAVALRSPNWYRCPKARWSPSFVVHLRDRSPLKQPAGRAWFERTRQARSVLHAELWGCGRLPPPELASVRRVSRLILPHLVQVCACGGLGGCGGLSVRMAHHGGRANDSPKARNLEF